MLDFVKKAFRSGIEVILWINLILWIIGGVAAGIILSNSFFYGELFPILVTIIIGVVVGLLTNIIGGGLIATFLNMDKNIEEQNNSLRQQREFIPTHRVKLLTSTDGLSLRKNPNPNLDPFTKLPNGTEVQLFNTGDNVEFQGIKAPWFEIRTKDNICGWCFSGSLEKI